MAGELSEDADRTMRQIFGNSVDESDLDLDFDEEDFGDNFAIGCSSLLRWLRNEMEFDLFSNEEDEEVEETENGVPTSWLVKITVLTVNLLGVQWECYQASQLCISFT